MKKNNLHIIRMQGLAEKLVPAFEKECDNFKIESITHEEIKHLIVNRVSKQSEFKGINVHKVLGFIWNQKKDV